jgi:hypothetical protein
MSITSGLIAICFVLVAMGWFALGWIARGHENRKYAESRLRALASRAAAEQVADLPHVVDAHRINPTPDPVAPVIHLHLPPGQPVWPQPPVIDSYPIRSIEGGMDEPSRA